MKNLKGLFKQISEVRTLAEKRAHELLIALGNNRDAFGEYEMKFYVTGTYFLDHTVNVKFREDTPHDCPETRVETVTIEQLELPDDEWDEYIDSLEVEKQVRISFKKEKKRQKELQRKQEQFEKLKKELGQ